jgi:hypothetical protein
MPLKAGKSAKTRSTNIREMVRSFKQSGRIGNTKPSSVKKVVQIAAAAAYRKAREG